MNKLMAATMMFFDVAMPDEPAQRIDSALNTFSILMIVFVVLAAVVFLGLILAVIIICVKKSKQQNVIAAAPMFGAEPAMAVGCKPIEEPAPETPADNGQN